LTGEIAEATPALPLPAAQTALRGPDWRLIIGLFVASRLWLTFIGLVTLHILPPLPAPNMGVDSYAATISDLYVRWDSLWYLLIAEHGYSTIVPPFQDPGHINYAFYPLYPLIMWGLSTITKLPAAICGLIVSNVSFLAALVVIYILAEHWSRSRSVAGLTVALLCLVPQSFVFSAVYTESLFLLLTALSMLLFEQRRFALAGLTAALGSASRSNGVFIVVYFGLALLRQRGLVGAFRVWRSPEAYLPIILAPLGLFAFWWFSMLTTGDAFAQKSTMVHGWHWVFDWPWQNIANRLLGYDFSAQYFIVASLVMFAASLLLLRRDTWPLFGYCFACFALFWTGSLANSLLRYAIVLFPIFYGAARVLAPHRIVTGLVLVVFSLGNTLLMVLWAVGSILTI
jgi:hypothetical protein